MEKHPNDGRKGARDGAGKVREGLTFATDFWSNPY
jgi:hypothetical protein